MLPTRKRNIRKLTLETLESRYVPATYNFINTGTTLIVEQIAPASGDLQITETGTLLTLEDGAGTVTFNTTGVANITYNLFPTDTSEVEWFQTGPRSGNVTFNLRNVLPREIDMEDGTGGVFGNVVINAPGGFEPESEIGDDAPAFIGGNLTLLGSLGFDLVEIGDNFPAVIGGNLTAININELDLDTLNLGGSVLLQNFTDSIDTEFDTDFDTFIGGNVTYFGGSGSDFIDVEGTISGNLYANFGSQLPFGFSAIEVDFGGAVFGNMTVIGGNLGFDGVALFPTGIIGGNLNMMLGGGVNDAFLLGEFQGQSIFYQAGSGSDSFAYFPDPGSSLPRITAFMGAGDDLVEIDTTLASLSFAFIDAGAGSDTLDVVGVISYPAFFQNF